MKHLFIPYYLAVKLKALGFDEECLICFYGEGKPDEPDKLYLPACFGKHKNSRPQNKEDVSAPIYQQVVEWLTNKGLYADVTNFTIYKDKYGFRYGRGPVSGYEVYFDSNSKYDAWNHAIDKALQILETRKRKKQL